MREVKGTLGEIQDAQQYNSQGIFLLLRVVGELVYNNDFRIGSRQALDQFSKRPPPLPRGTTVAVSKLVVETLFLAILYFPLHLALLDTIHWEDWTIVSSCSPAIATPLLQLLITLSTIIH